MFPANYLRLSRRTSRLAATVSNRKIKEYFYGDPRCVLSPFSSIIAFKDFKVYRFGQGKKETGDHGKSTKSSRKWRGLNLLFWNRYSCPKLSATHRRRSESGRNTNCQSGFHGSPFAFHFGSSRSRGRGKLGEETSTGIHLCVGFIHPFFYAFFGPLPFCWSLNVPSSVLLAFVRIRSEIDSVKGKLTILTPCPGRLPRRVLIMGSFKWSDI